MFFSWIITLHARFGVYSRKECEETMPSFGIAGAGSGGKGVSDGSGELGR